ncbi:hypothetical protein FE257_002866 [Aspergillus nanangensis]|uniref:Nephrocystin 3-like N-terminal domain-containing protein n=1 Tax=Aspergillus nanangensis TaxID=2582783 RepID=A0AAD4CU99_ASPNN|nr:hypothetical protein FE257_002866 [Aspergillus nanangensis]
MSKRSHDLDNDTEWVFNTAKRANTQFNDPLTPTISSTGRCLDAREYTVGWVSAIFTEYVAAQAFLDEEHDRPQNVTSEDNNDYTFGRIGKHNVVLAVLPVGGYGTVSAAIVARDMLHSFTNIKIRLMVGIGGGAPSPKHDIRLGDVVVSTPHEGYGGVFEYDFGKTMQEKAFQATGFLNQPPMFLQTAVNGLRAQHTKDGHSLHDTVNSILERKSRLQLGYRRPPPSSDRLYLSDFTHQDDNASCADICGDNPITLVPRAARTESDDNPTVHYGIIASANKVMKDASIDARQGNIKRAHTKTCKWLVKHPAYLSWLDPCQIDDHHGFLWIKGKPGTGKSTLMKYALSNARRTMSGKTIISHFFNARGDILERSTIGMYRSLLLQLLERHPVLQGDVFRSLGSASGKIESYQWSHEETLKLLFEQAVQNIADAPLICFIDALDECRESQVRDMVSFFENIGDLCMSADVNFQVCFSSRHYPHITISKSVHLVLEGQEGHSQDITSYVNSELKIGRSKLSEQIRVDLQEKASGVFMWIVLVVDILNKEHDAGRVYALRRRLQEIPSDLHELFRDILTRDLNGRGELLFCIQWVLFARSPLKPGELYYAILSGVEPRALTRWDADEITPLDMERFILNSSKGLAEVIRTKSPTVQFIHESVRDFLLKDNGLQGIWSDLGANFHGESHERLKKTCLGYIKYLLSIEPLPEYSSPESELTKFRESLELEFPFLNYAVRNVLYHADAAEGGGVSQSDLIQAFELEAWVKLDNLLERFKVRRHTLNVTFLYILAENNLANLINIHPNKSRFFDVGLERYGTPIFAALATKSCEAVEAFLFSLENRNEPNPDFCSLCRQYRQNRDRWPQLGRDFTFSQKKDFIIQLLDLGDGTLFVAFVLGYSNLENVKSKTNVTNSDDKSPVFYAAHNGNESAVKLLLEHGADPNSGISAAALKGHDNIVKLLLDHGADPNRGILTAAPKGHDNIVKLLLEHGADPNSGISAAALKGRDNIVKLLLDHGADPNRGILTAALKGHDNTVKYMLKIGARRNSQILTVALDQHDTIVKLLLEHGADPNGPPGDRFLPLQNAVDNNHQDIVKLLLESGADPTGVSLYRAARHGREYMVKLLLEKGCNPNSRSEELPLVAATHHGHIGIMKTLLEYGANIRHSDDEQVPLLFNPLEPAIMQNRKDVVTLLLEKGADPMFIDRLGRTPLMQAAVIGNVDIVNLFLEKGADPHYQDPCGATSLSLARRLGHEEVVKLIQGRAGHHSSAQCMYKGQHDPP